MVYVGNPTTWAIYGWPNESGIAHKSGSAANMTQAKTDARKALDEMAGPDI